MSDTAKSARHPLPDDFAAMAEHLPEMAWIATPTGRLVWGNRLWRDFMGTAEDRIETENWESLHDPAYYPLVAERWAAALQSGEPVELSFPLKDHRGVFHMFLTRAHPLRDKEGRITHWFGIHADVGELQAASSQLAEQTRLLEILNRTATQVAAELNVQNVVQIVVDASVALTGAAFGAFFYNVPQPNGDAYMLYAVSGVAREHFARFPMPRATKVFEPTFRGHGVVRSGDITQDPRYGHNAPHQGMPEGHLPVRSYLAAPVVSRHGEVMGGLFFGHPETDVFDEFDESLVRGLAAQAAIGIDNSRLYEQAQQEIAERRQVEAERLLLLRELNHRVKNLFAVTIGMIGMSGRTADSPKDMAETLTGRLRALARAHELIRPHVASSDQKGRTTSVGDIVNDILAGHLGGEAGQLTAGGPPVSVGPSGATGLALVIHELATNALKYGALSKPAGNLAVAWNVQGPDLVLTWRETGGPQLAGEPARKGFGTELARLSARGQLGGEIVHDWKPDGVEITLRASLERIGA